MKKTSLMPGSLPDLPRRALVTGGASGFGLAIAQALLAKAAYVAVGDVDSRRLREAQQALRGSRVLFLDLDVTAPASIRKAVDACQEHFGGLDTLVNSAGVIRFTPLIEITEEEWDLVLDVNLKGAFLCSQAASPLLCASGRGRIVNIGSDASKIGCPMIVPYCASKSGLVGLTKALASELAPHHVTVNCVCPVGVSGTGMGQEVLKWKISATGKQPEEILASTAALIPLKRNATVADVVNAVVFFLADASAFLTGGALDVDGGSLSTVPLPGTESSR
jgi:meso-butanediol dehydrogenase / (S,S)-butanediol dehydrogenase / diacetyl reductase